MRKLRKHEGALVVDNKTGGFEIVWPDGIEKMFVPIPMLVLAAVFYKLQDEEWCESLLAEFDDTLKANNIGKFYSDLQRNN